MHLVLGAGPAGLATAFHLVEQGEDVTVLEASPRAGGLIRTTRTDGLVVERGPQTLQASPASLRLVGRLGLRPRVLWPDPRAAHRYVLGPDGLQRLPSSPGTLLRSPLLSPADVFRMASEPRVDSRTHADETLADFVARRFGIHLVDAMLDPFVAGVFAGDPRQLDAATTFPQLVEAERLAGSVLRGMPQLRRGDPKPSWATGPMLSFPEGMQTLTDALATRLGDRLRTHTRVTAIRDVGGAWQVVTSEGLFRAERVWNTLPPATLADRDHPFTPAPTSPVVAVHLLYPRESVAHPLDGFGWLAPSHVRRDVLGCLWVSSSFPAHAPGWAMLRVMFGGTRAPELAAFDDDAAIGHARGLAADVEGIKLRPAHAFVTRANPGIPQFPPGYGRELAALQAQRRGVVHLGWEVSGIGLSHVLGAAERLTTLALA